MDEWKWRVKKFLLPALKLRARLIYAISRRWWWNRNAEPLDMQHGDERHDYATIAAIIDRLAAKSVLDVGCGAGRLFPLWKEKGVEALGIDVSGKALAMAAERYPDVSTVETTLEGFRPERRFDLMVAHRVLQHINPTHIDSAVANLSRLGERFYLNEVDRGDGGPGGGRSWFMFAHDYDAIFSRQGMELEEDGHLGSEHWRLYRRRPS